MAGWDDFAREYPLFAKRIKRARAACDAIPLAVLLWGPGTAHEFFSAREGLRDHLRSPATEVLLSEAFPDAPGLPGNEVLTAELVQAKAAHLIVVLLTDQPPSYGAEEEIKYYGAQYLDLRDKMRVIVPERLRAVQVPGPFSGHTVGEVLGDMPERHKFTYSSLASDFGNIVEWTQRELRRYRERSWGMLG